MNKLMTSMVFVTASIISACQTQPFKQEAKPPESKYFWQPVVLQHGEFFSFQTVDSQKNNVRVDLEIKQPESKQLLAIWRANGTSSNEIGKTISTPPEKILTASHAALIGESLLAPFLNTVLMSWWSKIDYFRWEIGFKRAVLVEMLAGFMVEVTDHCSVAGIIGYRVELKSGARLMAEACLAPSIALPLSVTRYDTTSGLVNFQAALLSYQKRN